MTAAAAMPIASGHSGCQVSPHTSMKMARAHAAMSQPHLIVGRTARCRRDREMSISGEGRREGRSTSDMIGAAWTGSQEKPVAVYDFPPCVATAWRAEPRKG